MLISTSQGHCAHKDGASCSVHVVLGAVIIAASVVDYALAITCIHCFEQVCVHLHPVTRKVRHAILHKFLSKRSCSFEERFY
jgi:hypothetical protein